MARAKDVAQSLSKLPRCIFCGARSADAVWIGHRTVGVCLQCATEVLPALSADAVLNRINAQRDDPQKAIAEGVCACERQFYRVVGVHLCRILAEWREAQPGVN